jgi:hypothetical protein
MGSKGRLQLGISTCVARCDLAQFSGMRRKVALGVEAPGLRGVPGNHLFSGCYERQEMG